MIVRVRFNGKHYNSGLWPNAKKGDTKVMSKPLFEQLCKDTPNQFVIVSVVDPEITPEPEQTPAPEPEHKVISKRGRGG